MKNNRLFKVILGVAITSFIFALCFAFGGVFAAEEVAATEETTEEATGVIVSALDWFKQIDAEAVKGWLGGLIAYLGANILVILALVIKIIMSKSKEYKQSQFYQELITKMDADHQKKVEELIESFNTKLDGVQASLNDTIVNLDEKKKEEAKTNIEVLKKNLDDIKVDLEK